MIGLILEITADYLREKMAMGQKFIDLQPDGFPPPTSPEVYVAINDDGMQNIAVHGAQFISERMSITFSCWTRNDMPPDRQGILVQWTKRYQESTRMTLDMLCRNVFKYMSNEPDRWELVKRINTIIDSEPPKFGDCINQPFLYLGTGRTERYTPTWYDADKSTGRYTFIGRRMQFVGMVRVQDMRVAR